MARRRLEGRRSFLKRSGSRALAMAAALGVPGVRRADETAVDYAESRYVDVWLRHPVYGDPSFDSFKRLKGNPILTGAPPYAWPVNGFFFPDPVSGNWYLYIGDYPAGYVGAAASRCLLNRSTNHGRTWENLGVVLHGDSRMFDKNGSTPDVSVVFDRDRYHMVYDWGTRRFLSDGGLAYAWADKPEGPWHRDSRPITRNSTLKPLLGRYQRTYAGTLVRRKNDWMILAMMDHPPYSWALFAMTAPHPQGPYSERVLIRSVEADSFHPPLIEFYPAFVDAGWVYAPGTSVALNRDFQMIFRSPLEKATDRNAWEIVRHGSVWHGADVSNEAYGIWGQTFSGWVSAKGTLWAMFPSRNTEGNGTINLAARSWSKSLRTRGFHLSGHQGPSLTLLRRAYSEFKLNADLSVHGEARVIWNYQAPLGPNRPTSNATLHSLSLTNHQGLDLTRSGWRIVSVDARGSLQVVARGAGPPGNEWSVTIARRTNGATTLRLGGNELWRGRLTPGTGAIGLLAKSHSYIYADRFAIAGNPESGRFSFLYTEAWLGAGENPAHWFERKDPVFRFGTGAVRRDKGGRGKWNFMGTGFTLWSPKGPDFGTVELLLDGVVAATLDLRDTQLQLSRPVFSKAELTDSFHAVVLRPRTGRLVIDSLDVIG